MKRLLSFYIVLSRPVRRWLVRRSLATTSVAQVAAMTSQVAALSSILKMTLIRSVELETICFRHAPDFDALDAMGQLVLPLGPAVQTGTITKREFEALSGLRRTAFAEAALSVGGKVAGRAGGLVGLDGEPIAAPVPLPANVPTDEELRPVGVELPLIGPDKKMTNGRGQA